jgi:hypothetical protein
MARDTRRLKGLRDERSNGVVERSRNAPERRR